MLTQHRCECAYFSAISCASPMTQEDFLCDPCREFKAHLKTGSLHFTNLANPSPHETIAPRSIPLKDAKQIMANAQAGQGAVRLRVGRIACDAR